MSDGPGQILSIDGRPDTLSNGWESAERNFAAMRDIRSGNEPDKPVAGSASHELVNLRRSFSPDPALAQALPVPVGHADRN